MNPEALPAGLLPPSPTKIFGSTGVIASSPRSRTAAAAAAAAANPPTGPPLRGPPSAELGTYENASAVQGRFWGPGGVSWQEAPYFLAAPKLCQNKKKTKKWVKNRS